VASALVDANLAGHDSHGVIRIPQYVEHVRCGEVVPEAVATVIHETTLSVLVDGRWGYGQVTAELATRQAVIKAKQHGLGASGAVRCTHIGRLGEYAEMAAREGIIAFVAAGGFGGQVGAAPFGGKKALLGTNPLSFGFPDADGTAMLVDFATTAIAAGKIRVARAKGIPLPPGSILDREGNPTTDAEAFYQGGVMLPFGGHKGYALSLVVEMLGRVLTGADDFAEAVRGGPTYGHSGTFVLAIDPGMFRDRQDYARSVDETLARVKAVLPAAGFDEVLIPGEPEARSRDHRERHGIEVEQATVDAIRAVGASLDIPAEQLF
jgi:LDH2 family malate/lactate/ureidoglycolate dehydrogenase